MPKTRTQKSATVESMTEKVKRSKSLVFTRYAGLTVKEVTELRRRCREQSVDYQVAKKTLMSRAFKVVQLPIDPLTFEGEVATLYSYADEVAPARILAQFAKEHPAIQPFGGVLEGAFVDAAKINELSQLPSKTELLAKAVGSIAAPLSGFVNVLAGNLRGLVQVLKSIGEKRPA